MKPLSPLTETGTIQILHVDDQPEFADLTSTFLEREDERFTVEAAVSASEGLDRLTDDDFDCVISDYDMPGMNGIEFLEVVRETYPDLPFILFTGKGSEAVASDAISAGVTDYLQKEGGSDQYTVLANRIANAIDHRRSRELIERSEQRLREIIDVLPYPLYVVDADGQYLLANEALASFHNTSADAIEGASVHEMLPEQAAEQFMNHLDEVLDGGTLTQLPEVELTDAAGTDRVLEPRMLPYRLDTHETQAVLGFAVDMTDRHHRTGELEQTRERMEIALEHTDSVIFEVDLETEEVTRDGAFERIVETATDEVVTLDSYCNGVVHPDDRQQFREFYQQFVDGDRDGGKIEYRTSPDHGRVRWMQDVVSVEGNTAARRAHAVGVARDITEEKQREQTLREKKRRYQAIFDDPNILVGHIDTDGTVLDINQTAMEYIDAPREDVIGSQFWETPWFNQSEADQRAVSEWVNRAAGGEYAAFETELVRPNGEECTISGVFRPVMDADGDVVSVLISGRDITAQRRHERELSVMKQRLEAILENTTAPMFMKDDEGRYILVNQAYRDLFGLDEGEVVGQFDDEVHPTELAEQRRTNDRTVIETGEPLQVEERITAQGQERVFLTTKSPIYDTGTRSDPETPVAVFGVASDITERKQRERELQRERDRLDEFASVVSHDIRNPLNVADLRLDLLQDECQSPHVDAIQDAIDRMEKIVEDVLWLAREGEDIGATEAVSLDDVVDAAWALVSDDANDATLTVATDLGTLDADADLLTQALENLFRNAIEHGGPAVTVTVGRLDSGFYIADDGPGIPPAQRADVFEAGYSTATEGIGFGLRIVEQVVTAHGWEIEVTESADGGARFEIAPVRFQEDEKSRRG